MTKASEFRQGNLFLHKGRVKSVDGIDEDDYILVYNNYYDDGIEHIKEADVEPIMLTPEWLERCGFTWDKGYMKINLKHARMTLGFHSGVSDKMSLFQTTIPGEGSVEHEIGFGSNHPECIHQLQNLFFALTGEELTIK